MERVRSNSVARWCETFLAALTDEPPDAAQERASPSRPCRPCLISGAPRGRPVPVDPSLLEISCGVLTRCPSGPRSRTTASASRSGRRPPARSRSCSTGAEHPMPEDEGGWRRLTAPEARAGSRYALPHRRRSASCPIPPRASSPTTCTGASLVVDPAAFAWSDGGWTGRPWEETVLYEVHVGTATPEGTYAGLMAKLEDLRDLGVTAIELMPLADFPGRRNWGYDGVLPFAPDAAYGTPDDLKRLVDRAHALGLMVFLDVVYNHFGPAGNYLHAYAKTFFTERHQTPWGAGINFDGAGRARPVRDFFVHNALYWLEEYHVDGLRFDAVHAILDDSEHAHHRGDRRARPRGVPGPARSISSSRTRPTRRAGCSATSGTPAAPAHGAVERRPPPLLARAADRRGATATTRTMPTSRWSASRAASPKASPIRASPRAHRGGERARASPPRICRPRPSSPSCRTTTRSATAPSASASAQLAAPERLALARAGLLLSPQIPLLFMGEEWAASTPVPVLRRFRRRPGAVRRRPRGAPARVREFHVLRRSARRAPDPRPDRARRPSCARGSTGPSARARRMPTSRARRAASSRLRRAEIVPADEDAASSGAEPRLPRAGASSTSSGASRPARCASSPISARRPRRARRSAESGAIIWTSAEPSTGSAVARGCRPGPAPSVRRRARMSDHDAIDRAASPPSSASRPATRDAFGRSVETSPASAAGDARRRFGLAVDSEAEARDEPRPRSRRCSSGLVPPLLPDRSGPPVAVADARRPRASSSPGGSTDETRRGARGPRQRSPERAGRARRCRRLPPGYHRLTQDGGRARPRPP